MEDTSSDLRQEEGGSRGKPLERGCIQPPSLAAVPLNKRTLDAIIAGVAAHLKDGTSVVGPTMVGSTAEPAAVRRARISGTGTRGASEGADGSAGSVANVGRRPASSDVSEGRRPGGTGSDAGQPRGMGLEREGRMDSLFKAGLSVVIR